MDWYDAIMGPLNLLDWAEGLVRAIAYQDLNPVRITLPHPEGPYWEDNPDVPFWNYNDVLRLLDQYQIEVFWRGFNDMEIWGHVKQKQARFAEYILMRAGAMPPATMQVIDERNPGWANDPRHNGQLPPRWDEREQQSQERERRE